MVIFIVYLGCITPLMVESRQDAAPTGGDAKGKFGGRGFVILSP
jgi:hypothetical protein